MNSSTTNKDIKKFYLQLLNFFGPQNWWPAETPYEVIVGAILTQNTSWKNVEKAIKNLKENNLLDINKISNSDSNFLSDIIKPSGFYRQKALRLKNISMKIKEDFGNIENMKKYDKEKLKEYLLSLDGIGDETADSILLYALEKPVFVVDAYTIRIFQRIGFPYTRESIKKIVSENFKTIEELKEFHALLVELAKRFCRKDPDCDNCPVKEMCDYYNGGKNENRDIR